MRSRCLNKNCAKYVNYGARGVTICDSWINSAKSFIRDAKRLPGYNEALICQGKLQLDKDQRILGSKIYGPDTCSWVSPEDNVKVKPSYMWWHNAYNIKTHEFVMFYNIHEFCIKHNLKEKSVSAISHIRKDGRSKGWLLSWFFWDELDTRKLSMFKATNLLTGEYFYDYKVGRLADTIGIQRNTFYKATAPNGKHSSTVKGYLVERCVWTSQEAKQQAAKVVKELI